MTTLPPPRADALAPGGQLALAVAGAQLGLDGRSYGPARALPGPAGALEGRSPEPLLGLQRGVLHGPVSAGPASGLGGPVQLALALADRQVVPQLGLWERLDQASALHAGDRPPELWPNAAKCHRIPHGRGPIVGHRTERGTWRWSGFVTCDLWSCPSCGASRARSTAATLGVAFQRHLAAADNLADVWMLTLAPPHGHLDLVGLTVDRLYAAHAAFKRSAAWKRFAERWGIASTVRVLDVTFGGRNGAHPHFHIALFPRRATTPARSYAEPTPSGASWWQRIIRDAGAVPAFAPASPAPLRASSATDRQTMLDGLAVELHGAWRAALRAAGVERAIGDEALKLTPAVDASSYFTAWGLADEVGAPTSKGASHLRLLDAATAGYANAGAAYLEWCAAVAGRQWVTGLDDLCTRYDVDVDDITAFVAELRAKRDAAAAAAGEPIVLVRPLSVAIAPWLVPAWRLVGPAALHAAMDAADAAGGDPQVALVDLLLLRLRAAGGRGSTDPPLVA